LNRARGEPVESCCVIVHGNIRWWAHDVGVGWTLATIVVLHADAGTKYT